MNKAAWTEAQVRELLATNTFTYQNVPLPHGLSTGGKDRSKTANTIFPAEMTGRSVLDIGCMYGFFCFDAENRGATRCVGADIDLDNVQKCRMLADARGSSAQFIHFNVDNDAIDGQYDYVLCLNVLHHLRNPIGVLEKLIAATRERLVLEVASFSPKDREKNGVSAWAAAFLRRLPVMYVAGLTRSGKTAAQTFFITQQAMKTLLSTHRASFAKVEIIDTGHKGRYIAIGHKRRIGHLVVIAGLQASGKSTFIDALTAPNGEALARQVGLDPGKQWLVQLFNRMLKNEQAELPNVLLHYNISLRLTHGDLFHHSGALSDLMATAEKVTIVTIWCPRERLRQQLIDRESRDRKSPSRSHKKKIKKLLEIYENEAAFQAVVDDWLDFCRSRRDPGFVVEYDQDYTVTPVATWAPARR